ncbi:hypothetical protein SOASR030_11840 [Leminorella grimontii]|uniref:Lipoprotein n=1 Tax=Leminorella grimontii TaxID=82981 RepID=A0AAV5N030_9GAMM|nr:hypothetical protein [Leminorella grimontii]KFC97567.1 hypothetical protein GLGR_0502 [Leminorella grimontii ATCC 33999 = DSM 5078]GKX55072.1 hypothetical protein SOASR030_11840 [Leminorella grimontii]GKX58496.1 hypothetical protein SOASR031_08110 [Leminorella grimontii]VFS56967.1 Uncharacterised protein [Leminorella grimontii]
MKWMLCAVVLPLVGCGTYQSGCDVREPLPIYKRDADTGEYRRDRRMERVREQGMRDGSTDGGAMGCR